MVGYFYWGFLGDKKYNSEGKEVSTPDGNAFYSWSIIKALQDAGQQVYLFSDRDKVGYSMHKAGLFSSFAMNDRTIAYRFAAKAELNWDNMRYAIVEWRWNIPGRNDAETKANHPELFQPDREMMLNIISECHAHNVPVVVFDLDYKLSEAEALELGIDYVIELGRKWENSSVKSARVEIPFDFTDIDEFDIRMDDFTSDVIYIGNRYERDWCIDKYLPEGTVVHGNWLEPGHGDPQNEWPHLNFRKRLSASEIMLPYNTAVSTVLLAKKEYCEMGFMTARIQEAVFYGTVPFFIQEYGDAVINTYAGKYAAWLKVTNKEDVETKSAYLKAHPEFRAAVIKYLRHHLRFMDSKFFVNDIENLVK